MVDQLMETALPNNTCMLTSLEMREAFFFVPEEMI
jgi:hypothetical protein